MKTNELRKMSSDKLRSRVEYNNARNEGYSDTVLIWLSIISSLISLFTPASILKAVMSALGIAFLGAALVVGIPKMRRILENIRIYDILIERSKIEMEMLEEDRKGFKDGPDA